VQKYRVQISELYLYAAAVDRRAVGSAGSADMSIVVVAPPGYRLLVHDIEDFG
jgi:hypothetical protein